MTERTAITLVFTAICVAVPMVFLGLRALHASNHLIVFANLMVLSVGSLSLSRVVVHYSDKSSSKRDRR
jgi:hypothetical protein